MTDRFSVNGDGKKRPPSNRISPVDGQRSAHLNNPEAEREQQIIEALKGRYDEIEALWTQAEEDLKRFRIPHAVVHFYASDDEGGYPIYLERLDDTQVASVEVGIGKARTAAIFRRPSKVFEDQVRNGRVAALALPGATPLQGGVPIVVDGKVIGAIGVSGNTPQEDEEVAKAGAASTAQAIQ